MYISYYHTFYKLLDTETVMQDLGISSTVGSQKTGKRPLWSTPWLFLEAQQKSNFCNPLEIQPPKIEKISRLLLRNLIQITIIWIHGKKHGI